MKENVAYLLGIVAGVAAVGIICWVKKRGRRETDYDERQYQTRDRACRYSFLTLLLYELVYGALYMKEAPSWCDYTMGNYLGIGLALLQLHLAETDQYHVTRFLDDPFPDEKIIKV